MNRKKTFNRKKYKLESKGTKVFLYEKGNEHPAAIGVFMAVGRKYLTPIALSVIASIIAASLLGQIKTKVDATPETRNIALDLKHENSLAKYYVNCEPAALKKDTQLPIVSIFPNQQNVIGFKNILNKVDTIQYNEEVEWLKTHSDDNGIVNEFEFKKNHFVFHRMLGPQNFNYRKVLFFDIVQQQPDKQPLYFISDQEKPLVVYEEPVFHFAVSKRDSLAGFFNSETFKSLSNGKDKVYFLSANRKTELANKYVINFPEFEELDWYNSRGDTNLKNYSEKEGKLLRSSVHLVPFIHKNEKGENRVRIVPYFSPMGTAKIDIGEIEDCLLAPGDDFLKIGENSDISLSDLINIFVSIDNTYLQGGGIDSAKVKELKGKCDSTGIKIDIQGISTIWNEGPGTGNNNGGEDVRGGNQGGKPPGGGGNDENVEKYSIQNFIDDLENLSGMALYDKLASFWIDDTLHAKVALNYWKPREKELIDKSVTFVRGLMQKESRADGPNNNQLDRLVDEMIAAIKENSSIWNSTKLIELLERERRWRR